MKSILYVGATLMIGASIYGFVDYEKTKNKKEFTNMYREAEVTEPVFVSDRKMTNPAESKEIAVKEKSRAVKKQLVNNDKAIEAKEAIEVAKPVTDEERMISKDVKIENTEVTVVPSKENVTEKIVKHQKRRLSTKLFSRGALDERYIKEEIKLDVPKTKKEPGKIENKEQ
jgi:predicted GIY-YIG superfamily endonuclease